MSNLLEFPIYVVSRGVLREGPYLARASSKKYGILGEGFLNIHVLPVPLLFLIWITFVLFVTRLIKVLPKDDGRWLISSNINKVNLNNW